MAVLGRLFLLWVLVTASCSASPVIDGNGAQASETGSAIASATTVYWDGVIAGHIETMSGTLAEIDVRDGDCGDDADCALGVQVGSMFYAAQFELPEGPILGASLGSDGGMEVFPIEGLSPAVYLAGKDFESLWLLENWDFGRTLGITELAERVRDLRCDGIEVLVGSDFTAPADCTLPFTRVVVGSVEGVWDVVDLADLSSPEVIRTEPAPEVVVEVEQLLEAGTLLDVRALLKDWPLMVYSDPESAPVEFLSSVCAESVRCRAGYWVVESSDAVLVFQTVTQRLQPSLRIESIYSQIRLERLSDRTWWAVETGPLAVHNSGEGEEAVEDANLRWDNCCLQTTKDWDIGE